MAGWNNTSNVSWRDRSTSLTGNTDTFYQTKTISLGSKSTKRVNIKFLDKNYQQPKIDPYQQSVRYWKVLEEAIDKVFSHETLPDHFHMEFLYKCATKLCRYEKVDFIAKKLECLFETHIMSLAIKVEDVNMVDPNLYINLNEIWNKFCIDIRFILNIFIVLDREHLKKTPGYWGRRYYKFS